MIIPFVGPFVSIVPPMVVVVLTNPTNAWWVILLLIVVQQTVLNAVGPRVFGHTVRMHPLLVIAAALSGATVAGFWGALFGIPAVGILASVARRYLSLRQQKETAPGPTDEAPAVAEAPAPETEVARERHASARLSAAAERTSAE
jgi:predicted PurR-regulated permease PerM